MHSHREISTTKCGGSLHHVGGGKVFSKLDLSFAYQQLEVDAESEQYLIINTDKGQLK